MPTPLAGELPVPADGTGSSILLTEFAFRSFAKRIGRVAPGAEFAVVTAAHDQRPVIDTSCGTNVIAWATADLFDDGGLGPFMRAVRQAPSLRWFQSAGAGTEHPVFRELIDKGVRVTTCHASTTPIAEYVLRSVLDRFQEAGRWRDAQRDGQWCRHEFREVADSTWLVVGLGEIGAAVARTARVMGAYVIGVRRRPEPGPADEVIGPEELLATLPRADVVVLAAPATPSTHHLVDRRFLSAMRDDAVLVNVARGALVDEGALLDVLGSGARLWAVLDTFATEPLPPGHPFWTHPRVTVTPHGSGTGVGRHARAADRFVENLRRWLGGRPLLGEVVDPTWGVRVERPLEAGAG